PAARSAGSSCLRRCYFVHAGAGIRDRNVTGVQTCALPIFAYLTKYSSPDILANGALNGAILENYVVSEVLNTYQNDAKECLLWRSEERRVGKECGKQSGTWHYAEGDVEGKREAKQNRQRSV